MTGYPIQSSFSRGEVSPRLRARVDLAYYKTALATCRNFFVLRQGGIRRRPGLRYVAEAKQQAPTIVRPFIFAPGQVYAIEFGDLYLRFHNAGGTVSNADGSPYEIVSPWAVADVAKLQFEQTGDVIRVVHANYAPRTLRRYGERDWRILTIPFEDGPYQDIITDGTILHPNSNGGIIQGVTGFNTPGLGGNTASSDSPGFPSWQAFDGNGNTEWMAGPGTSSGEYLEFEFYTPKIVTGYVVGSSPREESYSETNGQSQVIYKIPGSLRAPRGWSLLGSNDRQIYTVLDEQSSITGWGEGERRYFTFTNVTAYRYYRFVVSDINQSSSILRPVSIGTLKFSTGGDDIGLITFTVSSIQSINKGRGFQQTDVGRVVRFLSEDAYWHWFRIIGVVSPVQFDAEMYSPPLPSTNGTTNFRLGAFSDTSGWPARVGSFQNRIFYGRTNDQPRTVWGSRTDDYDSFTTSIPAKADDGVEFTVAAAGDIQWLAEGDALIFGTSTATRYFGAANTNEGFSATNFKQGTPLKTGALDTPPVEVGIAALFVGRLGTTLHELSFSFQVNNYIAPDIGVLSEHLLRAGVKEIAFALEPNSVLWAVMKDGSLVSMTYERDQQMIALTGHAIGGGGLVESVCVVPGSARDEVWFTVNRGGRRTIELLAADFEDGDAQEGAFYVDGGVTYKGAPTKTISGLPAALRGKQVTVLADGAPEGVVTVSADGRLTLPSGQPASTIHVGFAYTSTATTLRIAQGGQDGSGLGRKKLIRHVLVDMLATGDIAIATPNGRSEQVILRNTDDPLGEAVPFFTGSRKARVEDSWENAGVVTLTVSDPVPCTILAITPAVESEP